MTEKDAESADPNTPPRRSIRSFVIRAGRATVGQQRAMSELWPIYGLEYAHEPTDFDAVFGRQAPRMIEIGFGAGEATLSFAQSHPQVDCIGIEVHPPGVGHLMLGLHEAALTNTRIICHDAVEVLQHQIAPASIDAVHLFFPDPWPKKRHHKRRIVQTEFASLVARVLKPNGVWRLATDWQHYAEHMRTTLDAHPDFENVAGPAGFIARTELRPLTRFERRGQRLGHDVWDLEYRKRA